MTNFRKDPPPDELRSMIYYEDGEIYWNPEYRNGNGRTDKPIGCYRSHGYKATRISINGVYRDYMIHRLIWWLTHDEWPELLDHADGDQRNNKIENLRKATRTQNAVNCKASSKSGYVGVTKNGKETYRINLTIEGKNYYINGYKTAEAAALARDILSKLVYGDFARLNVLHKNNVTIDGIKF